MSEQYHIPVLYKETLEALQIQPDGIYVDCTFGGGGHSRGILEQLNDNGRLIAFDQDPDAKQNIPDDTRILFVPHNFRHIQRFLRLHKIAAVNGVLADLGVSSHQFDVGDRGFSIRFDGPLDMRMDKQQPETAEHLLQSKTEQELQNMFSQYGEVTNAKTLARHIVQQRKQATFKTINEFKALLAPVIKGNPNKYLAQVFQALRIAVNDEMGALKDMLQQLSGLLQPGARVAVITFHSLEDRLVKNFFRQGSFEEIEDNNPFVQHEKFKDLKVITKKPVVPTAEEAKQNPRSRSAKLRVAEKA
jgi:16S rRNA (cytosine1402-N4)-methyltransferase